MLNKLKPHRHYIWMLLGVLCIWQMIAMIVKAPILPTPYRILRYTISHIHVEMMWHLLYSLGRIVMGMMIAIVIAVPVGVLSGFYQKINHIVSPLLYFAYPVPKFALLPIVMLLFGIGEATKIVMVTIIILFPMIVNIRDAMKQMNKEIFSPFIASGVSPKSLIVGVALKGILPSLFTTLRIGIGTALSVLFFAENFGTGFGLGYYIMDSWMRINYVAMYSGILLMSSLGLILFLVVDTLNRRLCRWQ